MAGPEIRLSLSKHKGQWGVWDDEVKTRKDQILQVLEDLVRVHSYPILQELWSI